MDPHVLAPLCPPPGPAGPEVTPFSVSADPPSALVSVAGELDREHAHHVLDALAALAGTRSPSWTLEARRVTFCDAEGLRVLVAADRLARAHGRHLSVLPSPCIHRLVLLVGLDRVVDVRTALRPAAPIRG